jgi:regulatory protein
MRDRTIAEIRDKMKQKEYLPEEIEKTVNTLIEKNFLDDERFVINFIRSREDSLRSGKRKIITKLYTLGVPKEIIQNHTSDIEPENEFEKALELGQKWLVRKRNSSRQGSNDNLYQKLGAHLVGKGYEIDIVKKVLGELL